MISEIESKSVEFILSKLWEKVEDTRKETFESLRTHMRSLCARTLDVEEQIKKDELPGQKKRKRAVEEWLEQVQAVFEEFLELEKKIQTKGFVKRFFSSGGATKLDGKVGNLVEQHQHFGELVVDVDNKGVILLTNGLVGDEFEKNLETILKFLDDNVSSVGIYGMGGVGKTTLAKHINNRLLQKMKKSVFWTTISQELTIAMLQDEIAKFVDIDLSKELNEDIRAARLKEGISKKKNIIFILDDVWEHIDMKKFGDPLSVDGCKLLITTRSRKVCDKFVCEKIIKVEILKENEAWKLFIDTLEMSLTSEVQKIAKSMVKLCDGLPLGIITIAGSMMGETDLAVWKDALKELSFCVMDQSDMNEKVFKVLKYSFDRLDRSKGKHNEYSRNQHCFLYCSLYPEDHKIKRDNLIRNWILEEYLDQRIPTIVHGRMHSTSSRKDLFSQGKAILNELIKVCLLEKVDADHVKMHDLVRDMAHKISGGKTKVICGHSSLKEIPNEQQWGEDLEKLSLMRNNISKIPTGMSPNCPKLSTLLFNANPLQNIPLSFFKQMCSLCILDLSNTNVKRIPRSLLKLKGLKALLLRECSNLKIVPNLGELSKLRELDLSGTAIKEVLKGAEVFYDLKFLSLSGCSKLERIPEGLERKFPNLQCLHLPTHIKTPIEEIERLEHLEEFSSSAVKDVFECNRLKKKWSRSTYLLLLMFIDRKLCPSMYVCECFAHSDHQLIKSRQMEICRGDIDSIEDNGITSLVQEIQYLQLSHVMGLRNGLSNLLRLFNNPFECLHLVNCDDMECFYMSEQYSNGDAMTSTSTFPPSPPSRSLFSYLSVLKIIGCLKMKKLGIPASQLQNLQELFICDCHMLEEMIKVNEDNGGGESREAYVDLPKLKLLSLKHLPRLKSLCNGLIFCNPIERIALVGCQALTKLPLVFGHPNYDSPPSCLKEVLLYRDSSKSEEEEEEWWEKLEMGHDTDTIRPMLERVVRRTSRRHEDDEWFCSPHYHWDYYKDW